jgi:UDP-N-acetylmuramyl pentapeptide synthase
MAQPAEPTIDIKEVGPQKFELAVTFDGQRFDCGNYINRAAAQQAARLFVARKEGERTGRKKSPRRK